MIPPPTEQRRGELAANLAAVRARIAAAAGAAGRDPAELTLVAVTKTFPASDVVALAELGVTDVGENRDAEAAQKVADVGAALPGTSLRWHFVGQVQRNKAASVASYADVVHSVDRIQVGRALGRGAVQAGRCCDVLVQVALDADRTAPTVSGSPRGGVAPADAVALAVGLTGVAGVRLAGVMAVAPLGEDPPDAAFRRLLTVAAAVRVVAPDAVVVSAGMSGDLEAAVRAGATVLRVGTALLGSRPLLSESP